MRGNVVFAAVCSGLACLVMASSVMLAQKPTEASKWEQIAKKWQSNFNEMEKTTQKLFAIIHSYEEMTKEYKDEIEVCRSMLPKENRQ